MSAEELNELDSVAVAAEIQPNIVEARFNSDNSLTLLSGDNHHLKWYTYQSHEEIEKSLREERGVSVSSNNTARTYHTSVPDFRVKTVPLTGEKKEVVARSSDPSDVVYAYEKINNAYSETDDLSREDLEVLEETLRNLG